MEVLNVLAVHNDIAECMAALRPVDWTGLGMAFIDGVGNGDTALKLIANHRIDILLTDVDAVCHGSEPFVDYIALNKKDILLIVISSSHDMNKLLLAMRHQTAHDFLSLPLNTAEIEKALHSMSNYWHDFSLSLAVFQLTDIGSYKIPFDLKKNIGNSIKRIMDSASQANREETIANVSTLFQDTIADSTDYGLKFLQSVAVELLTPLKYMLINMGFEYNDGFALHSFISEIRLGKNKDDIKNTCLVYIQRYINIIAPAENKQKMSALVRAALQITHEQYCDSSFTLVSLAEELGISPNYLSSVFKMDTGMRFKNYLNTYRIGKAKELLIDMKYKIYEVSDLVGIEDSRYFSQIFKSYTGMKPSDYRNRK